MAVENTRPYHLQSGKVRPSVGFVARGEQHWTSLDCCVDLDCRHLDDRYGNVDPDCQQNGNSDENGLVHPDYAAGCRMVCVFAGRDGS